MMRIFAILICLACLAIAAMQMVYYLPLLPEKIVTAFDLNGQPAGWMGKEALAVFYPAVLAVVMGSCVIAGLIMHKLPVRFINIPNRDHYLSPPERKATLDYLRELYLWTAAFAGVFITLLMDKILRLNLTAQPQLDSCLLYTTGGTLVFSVICGLALVCWRFKKPKDVETA